MATHPAGSGLRPCTVFASVLAITLGLTAAAEPPPDAPAPTKETRQFFEKVERGKQLHVVNPLGNVYARFGGYEEQAEILATLQKLDPALPALEVRRTPTASGVDVIVGYGTVPGASARPAGEGSDHVDVVVFVPQGVALSVETRGGLIEAKEMKSDVLAASVSGEIRLRGIEGRVRANSSRGRISVALENGATTESQEFVTETGDIEVYVDEDAKARVHLATSGDITTDFSIEIEHRNFEEPGKIATAVIGGGGPEIFLKTKRGALRLMRQQTNFKPEG